MRHSGFSGGLPASARRTCSRGRQQQRETRHATAPTPKSTHTALQSWSSLSAQQLAQRWRIFYCDAGIEQTASCQNICIEGRATQSTSCHPLLSMLHLLLPSWLLQTSPVHAGAAVHSRLPQTRVGRSPACSAPRPGPRGSPGTSHSSCRGSINRTGQHMHSLPRQLAAAAAVRCLHVCKVYVNMQAASLSQALAGETATQAMLRHTAVACSPVVCVCQCSQQEPGAYLAAVVLTDATHGGLCYKLTRSSLHRLTDILHRCSCCSNCP